MSFSDALIQISGSYWMKQGMKQVNTRSTRYLYNSLIWIA